MPKGAADGCPALWSPAEGTATLSGELLDGTAFEGTSDICLVP